MHPRFDIRRALPAEFDGIYDLVNDGYGRKRSRSRFDWIYRRNPYGTARCWVVFDRASGQLVGCYASWPWPVARGAQWMEGTLDGDSVVAPAWQHQGIYGLRSQAWRSHAWQRTAISLSWPNRKSYGAGIKYGRTAEIVGPAPKAVLMLNTKAYLAEHHWPAFVSAAGGALLDTALTAWRELVLPSQAGLAFRTGSTLRIER